MSQLQSANFNEFRRRLADAAPAQPVSAADRQASGRVQPNIEERKTATASPDKLTLSKGSVKGAAPEAQIAQARQGKEEKERVAELSKNISELSRLQDKAAATGAASPASASRGPTVAVGSAASAPKAAAPATSASAGASAPAGSAPPAMAASAISSVKPGTATAPLAAASTAASVAAVASAAKPASASARRLGTTGRFFQRGLRQRRLGHTRPARRQYSVCHRRRTCSRNHCCTCERPRLGTRSQAKGRGRQASTTRAIAPGRPAGEPGRSGCRWWLAGVAGRPGVLPCTPTQEIIPGRQFVP
jgi:hypothetical protein